MELQIRTQQTPNPNAYKFILSQDVKASGKVSYTDMNECNHVPLACALLDLANVTQVHFYENVITVTQNGASEWGVLERTVGRVLEQWIPHHDIYFDESLEAEPDRSHFTDEMRHIDGILERTVRPGLQADGGDLELLELDGKILTIRYQGACGGCPSAMFGTLEAIRSILQHEFDPDLEVVAI